MTHIIKCKCLSCSLHFAVFSYSEDWLPAACPECKSAGAFMLWRDQDEKQIFEFVPGATFPVAILEAS